MSAEQTDAGAVRARRAMLLGLTLSCVLGAAGFVAWTWPLAQKLSTHTPVPDVSDPAALASSESWKLILANDQNLSLWGAADNARALARGDIAGLMWQGQCYPMPRASALGEHMFELGLLALPGWLATGDPVTAYNLALALTLLIAASGMFVFLHAHTGSLAASLAGAFAFAMSVPRLVDLPIHPAVVGTHWLPWVLWSFDRLLAGRRGGVPAFAATLLLSSIVGSYPLMAAGIVGASYGATVLLLRRDEKRVRAVLFGAAAALPAITVVAAIVAVFGEVQHEWVLPLNSGPKFLVGARDYLPGGTMPVGAFALLGLVPLLFLRGPLGRSALTGLAAAAAVAFVLTTRFGDWSLYELLSQRFVLFDSVRGPGKTALAVCFCVQAMAAIGWSRVAARVPAPAAALLGATLVALVFVEVEAPRWTRGLLGSGAAVTLREVAPPRDRIETLASALGDARDRRAVLDLPVGRMVKAPLALLDAAYHGHPTSACYNSLVPPTTLWVQSMTARARTKDGVLELANAGFGFIVERPSAGSRLSASAFPVPARLLAFESDLSIWALPHPGVLHRDVAKLALKAVRGVTRATSLTPESPHELEIEVSNPDKEIWAAPQPLVPLLAEVTLTSPDGQLVQRSRARGVLPPALAGGAATTIVLNLPDAPPAGSYRAVVTSEQARIEAGDLEWSVEAAPK